MRKAQTDYESCAEDYQLRIKTLNQVGTDSSSRGYRAVGAAAVDIGTVFVAHFKQRLILEQCDCYCCKIVLCGLHHFLRIEEK